VVVPTDVLGNIEIHFTPANAKATVPAPLTYVAMSLTPADGEVGALHNITRSEGRFDVSLDPGGYRLDGLLVSAKAFRQREVFLPLEGPAFDAPDQGCVYIGRVIVEFIRLPPGSTETQFDALRKFLRSRGESTEELEFVNAKGGGVAGGVERIDLPPEEARPPGWEECTVEQASL
jgi:hypothetical protein